MTFKKLHIAALAIVLLGSGCKKDELPPSSTGTPAFATNISVDGTELNLIAGQDDLVLNPYLNISGDSLFFINELGPESCEGCGPGFNLQILSPISPDSLSLLDLEQELLSWDYYFAPGGSFEYYTMISASATPDGVVGLWYLDGVLIEEFTSNSITFNKEGFGSYELDFIPSQDCENPPTIEFETDQNEGQCYGHISNTAFNPFEFTAIASPSFDLANIQYEWFAEDTVFITSMDSIFSFNPLPGGYEEICVTMSDGNCSFTSCYALSQNPAGCQSNIQIDMMYTDSTFTMEPNAIIELEVIGENGVQYVSQSQNQTDDEISLISLEPYQEPTVPGKSYFKAGFEINTNLIDPSGIARPLNGSFEIALEIPE